MQRRKVPTGDPPPLLDDTSKPPPSARTFSPVTQSKPGNKKLRFATLTLCFVLILWLHDSPIFSSPRSNKRVRSTVSRPKTFHMPEIRTSQLATDAMLRHDSSFVDGERKLKKSLVELETRQKGGVDRGVKFTTRFMGDNVPVWESLPKKDEKPADDADKINNWKLEENRKKAPVWIPKDQKEESAIHEVVKEEAEAVKEHPEVKTDDDEEDDSPKEVDKSPTDNDPSKFFPDTPLEERHVTEGESNFPDPVPSGHRIEIRPSIGAHRPDKNAVFSFAQGYSLDIYLNFLESLEDTGYDGDVVLSIAHDASPELVAYLNTKPNVVVYQVQWGCITRKGAAASGSGEGINWCKMMNFYEVEDVREHRPVATARYELYHAWSLMYSGEKSLVLLIDFRDTYFQMDPFEGMEIAAEGKQLWLYGENSEATSLGESTYNRNWLTTAYGKDNVQEFLSKPTICSGSTIATASALVTYLRAMIAQWDETKCNLKGCDQGFHNYLYYSNILKDKGHFGEINMVPQGKGNVNNLGAMRTKPLREWGAWDGTHVKNWDGSVTPVAHQIDRDGEVNAFVKARKRIYGARWKEAKAKGILV